MSLIKGCPEIESEEDFYVKADDYWKSIPSTIDGMLGGFSIISEVDIRGSKLFLKQFIKGSSASTKTRRALDCGAGIGRVSKHLLLPSFKTVDLVELNQDFINKSEVYLGSLSPRVGHYFCCGLQSFQFTETYDLIWVQWVTGHLTDDHFVEFLQRCKESLNPGGIIVIKDNNASNGCEHDKVDSSVTRTTDGYKQIYLKSGLRILKHQVQKNFPSDLYKVTMTALGL